MKSDLIGFIVSALLHAGLISGVLALNNQPEKKLIPEKKVVLMVKMFQSEVSLRHFAPTVIDNIVSNHSITPAPVIKRQPLKKKVKPNKKPQAIFVNSISKPQNIKKKIKRKTRKNKVNYTRKVLKNQVVKQLKNKITKNKNTQNAIIKKNKKRLRNKKITPPITKRALAVRKEKMVKRKVKRNIKPTRHYVIRKIKPKKQAVIIRNPLVPYRKSLHRKALPQKHAVLANRPIRTNTYNKVRGKSISRKQVKIGRVKTTVRMNKKHIVAKRKINNRPRQSSVPQYSKKVNSRKIKPRKLISKHVQPLNKPHKTHLQQKLPVRQHPKKINPKKAVSINIQQLNQQYKVRLQQIIVSKKSYPRRARRHGQQGKVTLSFSVSHSGIITDIRILKSSGIPVLDKASIQAIQRSSKILRFFPKMPKKSMKLRITLHYLLNG